MEDLKKNGLENINIVIPVIIMYIRKWERFVQAMTQTLIIREANEIFTKM